MSTIKKLAIFGGTFNPPHLGHLLLAENAAYELGIDKILFMVAGKPPHKSDVESASCFQRFEMVKILAKDNSLFDVSDFEINSDKPSYTARTLSELEKLYPGTELYFILGLDSFYDLEKWYSPEIIFEKAVIVVSVRGGMNSDEMLDRKLYYEKKYNAKIKIIKMPEIEISSSDIRLRIKQGRPIKYMTTEKVEEYIYKNKLYL